MSWSSRSGGYGERPSWEAWDAKAGYETQSYQAPASASRVAQEPTATKEEMEDFIQRNEQVLSVDAKLILREMKASDGRVVIDGGDLPRDTSSPVWIITERLSKSSRPTPTPGRGPVVDDAWKRAPSPPQNKRGGLMDEGKWQNQRSRNQQAAAEGRALYVRGIPPAWGTEELKNFFEDLGEVESVNLLQKKPGQPALAGFVNFATHEETLDAAKACDRLQVQDSNFDSFELACSIKGALGQKVDMVSGFTELSRARQEKRALYVSQMPKMDEWEIRALFEQVGSVEAVRLLPGNDRNLSVFVIMGSPEEARAGMAQYDGSVTHGKTISVSLPKVPKRTRDPVPPTPATIDLCGFPADATEADVLGVIAASGREAKTVQMMGAVQGRARCLVLMGSAEDAAAVISELDGFEFLPGHDLTAKLVEGADQPPPSALPAGSPAETQGASARLMESLKGAQYRSDTPSGAGSDDAHWGAGYQGPSMSVAPAAYPLPPSSKASSKVRPKEPSIPPTRARPKPKPTCAPHVAHKVSGKKRKMEQIQDAWALLDSEDL